MGSPHQRGNTPYGSVAPSWLPSPPSSRCGSPSRSTTSPAHPSSTGSASKQLLRMRTDDSDLLLVVCCLQDGISFSMLLLYNIKMTVIMSKRYMYNYSYIVDDMMMMMMSIKLYIKTISMLYY